MFLIKRIVNNYRRLANRKSVAVVQEDDLEAILSALGVIDKVKNGAIPCSNCGSPVNLQNLSGWKKFGFQLLMFCDKPQCLLALSTHQSEGETNAG
jgi:hypothetical protein